VKRKRITYIGWTEGSNLGDEALYLANQKVFGSYELVPDYKRYGIQHSRITLFGGGTLLPFLSFWVRPNKYNYAFGVGVEILNFWSEFFPKEAIEKTKKFNFRLLGVRGEISRQALRGWGINSQVVGDPCLLLEPSSYMKKKEDLITLNFSSINRIWGYNRERILREVTKLCKALQVEGYSLVLVLFCKEDMSSIERVTKIANVEVFDDWKDIRATINFIASSRVLIGERLHSAIFSASTYTPFVMIAYRPKCFDFVDTVGFRKYTLRTDEMTCEKVMRLFRDLVENWKDMRRELVRNVETYRKKLKDFAVRITDDIESLPDDKWSTPNIIENIKWRAFQQTDRVLHYKAHRIWRAWHRLQLARAYNAK